MTALLIIAATLVVAITSIVAVQRRSADGLSDEIRTDLEELRRRRMDYFGEGYIDINRRRDESAAAPIAD